MHRIELHVSWAKSRASPQIQNKTDLIVTHTKNKVYNPNINYIIDTASIPPARPL